MNGRGSRDRQVGRAHGAVRWAAVTLLGLALGSGAAWSAPASGARESAGAARPGAPAPRRAPAAPAPASQAPPTGAKDSAAREDDGLTLKGGQEGTVFRSLTVEGEDRVHVEIERPALSLDLEPETAPGLEWGDARDVLDRTVPDLVGPLARVSAAEPAPYLGRPWLDTFGAGAVARFTPAVDNVARWRLLVADARGDTVAGFSGEGRPPREIAWDGRGRDGRPVTPGLTYSYVFEARDRAGNRRHFVGQGFTVTSYRVEGPAGPMVLFSGRELGTLPSASARDGRARGDAPVPLVLLEAASWLNQTDQVKQPLRVTATARDVEAAEGLARSVVAMLAPLLLGDPSRLRPVAEARPDAPEGGTVTIAAAR
jgi:hypothetical protein